MHLLGSGTSPQLVRRGLKSWHIWRWNESVWAQISTTSADCPTAQLTPPCTPESRHAHYFSRDLGLSNCCSEPHRSRKEPDCKPASAQCLGDNSFLGAEDASEIQPFVMGSAGMFEHLRKGWPRNRRVRRQKIRNVTGT